MAQEIYLFRKSRYIPDDIAKKIDEIIDGYRICNICECEFDEEHIEISYNTCRPCIEKMLRERKRYYTFEYLGDVLVTEDEKEKLLTFYLRNDGYVLVFSTKKPFWQYNYGEDAIDLEETLRYWKFIPPLFFNDDGKPYLLDRSWTTLYTPFTKTLKETSIIILVHKNDDFPEKSFRCLLYERGGYLLFPEKIKGTKGDIHKLYLRANHKAKEYQDENGYDLPDGSWKENLDEEMLFRLMCEIEDERFTREMEHLQDTCW